MKDLAYVMGAAFVVALIAALVFGQIQAQKPIGTMMSYQNEVVTVLAIDNKTYPVLYVVRRKDGTTLLAPLGDLKPLTEKP